MWRKVEGSGELWFHLSFNWDEEARDSKKYS
jgi:hypothetical protein